MARFTQNKDLEQFTTNLHDGTVLVLTVGQKNNKAKFTLSNVPNKYWVLHDKLKAFDIFNNASVLTSNEMQKVMSNK